MEEKTIFNLPMHEEMLVDYDEQVKTMRVPNGWIYCDPSPGGGAVFVKDEDLFRILTEGLRQARNTLGVCSELLPENQHVKDGYIKVAESLERAGG